MIELEKIPNDMIANNIAPYEPTHPGELLRDEIEERQITQKQLAKEMGVSYAVLNDVVNGKRPVSIQLAMLCEAALGVPANVLVGLQADYDMQKARQNVSFMQRLNSIRRIAAMI